MYDADPDLLNALRRLGVASSAQLQQALRKSQATVSRMLTAADAYVLVLGRARRTRYALPEPLLGLPAEQDLHWIDEEGRAQRWGRIASLVGGQAHVLAEGIDHITPSLPWFLSPLRGEGFLGRALAQRLAAHGLDANPERWRLHHALFAALHTPDAPGALVLGEPKPGELPDLPANAGLALDRLSGDTARTFPIGSSAGGEQPKLLVRGADGHPLLVKFSPLRGTPFGERWNDLLHAEALALEVLGASGVNVAEARIVRTAERTYLRSRRFDRVGTSGRRHVVPLWAVHEAFVPGPPRHWTATCEVLEARRRLPRGSAAVVAGLQRFGRLIGNSDVHFGNLSLVVAREDVARGRFSLAPVYDMLPMRWRPDAASGSLELWPFTPELDDVESDSARLALEFWGRVAGTDAISAEFRRLAAEMGQRIRSARR
jgi:hypothetical protein